VIMHYYCVVCTAARVGVYGIGSLSIFLRG
jgi:hypothetical protein